MEYKTKIKATEGRQEIYITREFDIPVDLLFKAHIEPDIVSEWMNTRVIKLESKKLGGFEFETTDPMGNKHGFHGCIHDVVTNEKIIRTFEMSNTAFPPQLEYLIFSALDENKSQLTIQIVFKSIEDRDNLLKLPFNFGLDMAHNKLENIMKKK